MAEPSFPPYNVGDLGAGVRRQAPAAARNVGPIGDVLTDWLPSEGLILEIAAGTGEHALAFATRFPHFDWIPSDPDPQALASIDAWRAEGPPNLGQAVQIDTRDDNWPVDAADAILCINMVHISPWESAIGLLNGAQRLLGKGGPLILYGPWIEDGVDTAPSNIALDESLRARDGRWGLRRVEDFAREGEARGLVFADRREMPSNNIMLRLDYR
jgi:hypothetical protein